MTPDCRNNHQIKMVKRLQGLGGDGQSASHGDWTATRTEALEAQ
jgi:hypothetical protein